MTLRSSPPAPRCWSGEIARRRIIAGAAIIGRLIVEARAGDRREPEFGAELAQLRCRVGAHAQPRISERPSVGIEHQCAMLAQFVVRLAPGRHRLAIVGKECPIRRRQQAQPGEPWRQPPPFRRGAGRQPGRPRRLSLELRRPPDWPLAGVAGDQPQRRRFWLASLHRSSTGLPARRARRIVSSIPPVRSGATNAMNRSQSSTMRWLRSW